MATHGRIKSVVRLGDIELPPGYKFQASVDAKFNHHAVWVSYEGKHAFYVQATYSDALCDWVFYALPGRAHDTNPQALLDRACAIHRITR